MVWQQLIMDRLQARRGLGFFQLLAGPPHRHYPGQYPEVFMSFPPVEKPAQREAEAPGRLEGVDHVQVVRPALGPVLVRVHRGVRAHELRGPLLWNTQQSPPHLQDIY